MFASILNAFMRARSVEATLVFLEENCQNCSHGFHDILEEPSGIGVQRIAHVVKAGPVTQK